MKQTSITFVHFKEEELSGVSIYAKNNLKINLIKDLNLMDNAIEQVWCSLKYEFETIILRCIYRPSYKFFSLILLSGDFNLSLIKWDAYGLPDTKTDSLIKINFFLVY